MPKYTVNYPNTDKGVSFVEKDGSLTDESANFIRTIYETLNANFNSQGTVMPALETGEIGNNDDGVAYYNIDNDKFQIRIDGDIHNVSTTVASQAAIQFPEINDVNTILNPKNGLTAYDISDHKLKTFANGVWVNLHV